MSTHSLRSLIESRINIRWTEWSKRHPHLAEAIDRVRLTETVVERIQEDPDFIAAMREADLDEADLNKATGLLDRADGMIRRLLPI